MCNPSDCAETAEESRGETVMGNIESERSARTIAIVCLDHPSTFRYCFHIIARITHPLFPGTQGDDPGNRDDYAETRPYPSSTSLLKFLWSTTYH